MERLNEFYPFVVDALIPDWDRKQDPRSPLDQYQGYIGVPYFQNAVTDAVTKYERHLQTADTESADEDSIQSGQLHPPA